MKYSIRRNQVVAKGNWPKGNRAGIRESIRKWKFVVRYLRQSLHAPTPSRVTVPIATATSCALCHIYVIRTGKCEGCPVREATRRKEAQCRGTPYINYAHFVDSEDKDGVTRALAWAEKEVVFLESLIEAG